MIEPLLLDKLETARRLGISVRGLDRLIRDPDNPLPYIPVGRLIKFRPADVQRWLEGKVTTAHPPRQVLKSKGGAE